MEREDASEQRLRRRIGVAAFGLAFLTCQGKELTLGEYLAKLFCVLSGPGASMLPHDPLETDQGLSR